MKKIQQTIASILNVKPGEEKPTRLLFLNSFFIGASSIYMGTAAYTLFLTDFPVTFLPYVYIISALVNTAIGYVYSRLESRLSFPALLSVIIVFLILIIALIYIGMLMISSKWTSMALIIAYNVATVLAGLVFWGLAGRMLDVRQGKRLYGVIGSGAVLAAIIGGFSVPYLLQWFPTPHLLLPSSIAMICCLGVLIRITGAFNEKLSIPEQPEKKEKKRQSAWSLAADPYLVLIFSVAAFSLFGYYLVDYIFYDQVESRFVDEKKLAGFLGMFYALFRVFGLFNNAFLYSRLINRFGIGLGILAVPATVAVGFLAASLSGILSDMTMAFFWIIVATKLFDEVFRVSIEEPSIRILYQPIPAHQRLTGQAVVETMVEPVAGALAGIMLAVFTSYLSFGFAQLTTVLAIVTAGWIVLAVLLRRKYTVVLGHALRKRVHIDVDALLQGGETRTILQERLKSKIPGEVIYSFAMLEEVEQNALKTYMKHLLVHSSPQVRKHVLQRIEEQAFADAQDPVSALLERETVSDVKGAALQTLCAAAGAEMFEKVAPYLDDPEREVRKGAMVGLLRHSGIEGLLSAGNILNSLIDSKEAEDRLLASEVLGGVGSPNFYRPLLKLLQDEDSQVQRSAILSAGKLKNPKLLPQLVEKFSVPSMRSLAVSSIVAFGESILPALENILDRERQPSEVRVRLIRILGRIGGEKAIGMLKSRIDFEDEDIRNHVLKALIMAGYQAEAKDVPAMRERIRAEAEDAAWALSALLDMGEHEDVRQLVLALKEEFNKNRDRIFRLMAMIYPASLILDAQTNLFSNYPEKRAYSLEVIDNLIDAELKASVFPLIDDMDYGQRLFRLNVQFPQKRTGPHERLKEILIRTEHSTSSWTKACALFCIGKIATMEFFDSVVASLSNPDPTVRETAVWALGCLNPDDLGERLKHVTRDKSPRVARFARFVINSVGFASIPMSRGYLTRSGRYTVELFKSVLEDEGERRARRCRAANILSRFKGPPAKEALLGALSISDKTVRTAVLDALVNMNADGIEERRREDLIRLLRVEIKDAKRIVRSIAVFVRESHSDRLIHALNSEINRNRRRILSILALLNGPGASLTAIFYWYIHQDNQDIPQDVADNLNALMAHIKDDDLKRSAKTLFNYRDFKNIKDVSAIRSLHTQDNVRQHLMDIAFGSSVFTLSWSRICALEMIVRLDLQDCTPQVADALDDPDEIVRATSAWALFKLSPERYSLCASKLKGDRSPLVSKTADQLHRSAVDMEKGTF